MSEATLEKIPPARVRPMPGQPRIFFHPERMQRLSDSIRSAGQITPGIVRAVPIDEEGHDYELLDGERRLRAVLTAEAPFYRALLVDVDDEAAPYIVSVVANFNREGHAPMEFSDSIAKMHDGLGISFDEIGGILGFTRGYIVQLYGLQNLVDEVRDLLDPNLSQDKQMSVSAAIRIAKLPESHQETFARKVMRRELTLATLDSEVQRVAVAHGFVVRKRVLGPSERQRSIDRRIQALGHTVHKFRSALQEARVHELNAGWSPSGLEKMLGELAKVRRDVDACYDLVDRIVQHTRKVV